MGYQDGKGIGAKPGITKPISESDQKGTQGLGFKVKHFDKRIESWDYEIDQVKNELFVIFK
jgi:hypothetical protein